MGIIIHRNGDEKEMNRKTKLLLMGTLLAVLVMGVAQVYAANALRAIAAFQM